ncbi:MAG: Sulfurtransferase TusA [Actinobacteria bacterium]|nr:Sulfurtransferase TusA [Actinomycetota bacterium]
MSTVDARGLSCPQPVMMSLEEMAKIDKGELEILVDTDTAKENCLRAAKTQKWQLKEVNPEGIGYRIIIRKD